MLSKKKTAGESEQVTQHLSGNGQVIFWVGTHLQDWSRWQKAGRERRGDGVWEELASDRWNQIRRGQLTDDSGGERRVGVVTKSGGDK